MIKEFIKQLLNEINKIYVCYYEEAPNTAEFPYLVIPTLHLASLNDGYSGIIDIEINNNEQNNVLTEDIMDNLKRVFDNFSFINEKIGFHLNFESMDVFKSSDQDLVYRRVSFDARLFYCGG